MKTREQIKRLRLEQRLMGLALLVICCIAVWLCSTGTTVQDKDATAVVLLAPLALYMIFTKEIVIV